LILAMQRWPFQRHSARCQI